VRSPRAGHSGRSRLDELRRGRHDRVVGNGRADRDPDAAIRGQPDIDVGPPKRRREIDPLVSEGIQRKLASLLESANPRALNAPATRFPLLDDPIDPAGELMLGTQRGHRGLLGDGRHRERRCPPQDSLNDRRIRDQVADPQSREACAAEKVLSTARFGYL